MTMSAFLAEDRTEAPKAVRGGAEPPVAKRESESLASTEQLMEEVCQRPSPTTPSERSTRVARCCPRISVQRRSEAAGPVRGPARRQIPAAILFVYCSVPPFWRPFAMCVYHDFTTRYDRPRVGPTPPGVKSLLERELDAVLNVENPARVGVAGELHLTPLQFQDRLLSTYLGFIHAEGGAAFSSIKAMQRCLCDLGWPETAIIIVAPAAEDDPITPLGLHIDDRGDVVICRENAAIILSLALDCERVAHGAGYDSAENAAECVIAAHPSIFCDGDEPTNEDRSLRSILVDLLP